MLSIISKRAFFTFLAQNTRFLYHLEAVANETKKNRIKIVPNIFGIIQACGLNACHRAIVALKIGWLDTHVF